MADLQREEPASTPKRDRLLDTAMELFYRDGYHAVGIDTILAEAKLAKMTLYHHFSSKEELIVAALERRGRAIAADMRAAIDAAGASPRKRLLALFDWHEQWMRRPDFNGCGFIRAVGEYPEVASPVHQVVIEQKRASRALIKSLLTALGAKSPDALAEQIHLLIEGAIVSAHLFGDPSTISRARSAALSLLKTRV